MNWTVTFYNGQVEDGIQGLPASFVARFVRYAERMEIYGLNLGMPHTRAMGEGLFELRPRGRSGIGRAFYCFLVGRRVVVIHAFVKKTQQTPDKELKLARKRMKEIDHG